MSREGRWEKRLAQKLGQLEAARASVREEREQIASLEQRQRAVAEAQAIVQAVAQAVQSRAHEQIARIASRCMDAVYDDPYELKIHFERKRGRTEARLAFERDGEEVDPVEAAGGGFVDVASFALRVAGIVLAKPPQRRFLCMDESFKYVQPSLRPRVRVLLETICKELGFQILHVTHDDGLKAGKVIHLEGTR